MARNALLLIAGAIVGGAAVLLYAGRASEPLDLPSSASREVAAGDVGAVGGAESPSSSSEDGFVAARVAAYERALGATDATDLESMIELTIAEPRSRARDLDLAALMARLAELDPERAVAFARSAYLDSPLMIQAFEALARTDAEAAVRALTGIAPPARQRKIAMALLDVVGLGADGVDLVASALPDEARAGFELDALLARARIDPISAVREAAARPGVVLQLYLLPRLAEIAAQQDPAGAFALGELFDNDSRRIYEASVMTALAELDPERAFEFLASASAAEPGAEPTMSNDVLLGLARYDADRLLALAESLPPANRANAQRAVMQSLAESDPEAAIAMLDSMPGGQYREVMLATIAQTYGRQNPDLALAWAKSLQPPSQSALQGVLQGIAAVDGDRAIELFFEELAGPVRSQAVVVGGTVVPLQASSLPMMLSLLSSGSANARRLADRLLELDDPRVRSELSSAIALWASRDSEGALNWTLANADRLEPAALRNVAQSMAIRDLDLAVSTVDRLPPSRRAAWVEGVAASMAQTDIGRAQGFLDQLRGQPGYEAAYGAVTQAMVRADPAAAARMLENAPSVNAIRTTSFALAREWTNRDPAAAGRWALNLEDAEIQRSAINTVASTWAQRDAAAAERWIFGIGSGPQRDAAADGYIDAAAQAGRFEPRLLEAYSSAENRQRGASRAIVTIGGSDPTQARRLLDTYVTDPATRARIEEQLARGVGSGNAFQVTDQAIIVSQ